MSWKVANINHYFNQISSGKWVETKDDKVIFSFDEVEIKKSNEDIQVILFDPNRNFYLSLNNKDVRFGSSKESIDNILYEGSWQNNEPNEKKLMSWKVANKNHYFNQASSTEWFEIVDNNIASSFDLVEIKKLNEDIQVILFASGRNFYLSLNNKDVRFGSSKESIDNLLYQGSWQL
jgi:hypothetical protein